MPRIHDDTDQSQDFDDDDSKDQQKLQIRKPKIERLDKFKTLKKIIINVSMTQYPVVSQVAEQLNWKIQTSNDAGDWDIYWTDYAIDPDILIRMHLFQKINHFPGIHTIARKNLLGLGLMNLRNKFPQQYNFFPLTWMLPAQYAQFRLYYENRQKGKCRTYIVKPQAQCQGRGIFLTRKIQDMQNGKHYVVQRYIARPYLIDGLKFDFRIYVLLCGTDPLKLYIYNQGLARFATQRYVQPCTANLDQAYIHLTNYAINKHNPKFIFNTNSNNMSIGHKRSLTSVYKQLAQKGIDVDELKKKINDIAIKTIITGLPLMAHQYKCSQPQDYSGNMCFHILGLDIMLNNKGQPFLIEVNHTPSFTTDTPLDYHIKYHLIKDTLVLMNINAKKKNQLFNRCKQYNQERLLTGKRHIFQGEDRKQKIIQQQRQRQQHQKQHLGGFMKIYPTQKEQDNSKYTNIIQYAIKNYFQENGSLRMKFQQKQAKRLIRSDIKKQKELRKKQKQTKGQDIQNQKNIEGIKEVQSVKKQQQEDQEKQKKQQIKIRPKSGRKIDIQKYDQIPSPIRAPYRNKIGKMENQLIKSQLGPKEKALKILGGINQKIQVSELVTTSAVRQLKSRGKSKHLSSKKDKNSQLPNIQQGSSNNLAESFNRSQFITKNSMKRQRQRNLTKHDKQDKLVLHSQPKSGKLLDSIAKQIRDFADKKNGGGYVMPKIFCLNFQMEKKIDLHYLTLGKKAQSAHYAQ